MFVGFGSRRQSLIPRGDIESTYSLQGSMHTQRDSPRPSHRKYDRAPLFINHDSNSTWDHMSEAEQLEFIRKPLAMVRPRQILSSSANTSDDHSRIRDLQSNLRECKSLDPFPSSQLRKRTESIKLPIKMAKQSSRSLDGGGGVSMISYDPNFISDRNRLITSNDPNGGNEIIPKKDRLSYKHLNNNCNGSIGAEDPNCPLLFRQASLNSPHDDSMLLAKRWRSLETVGGDEYLETKKTPNNGSIKQWLVGIFNGNGFRSSNASLRKVGAMQSGVRGLPGFGELPSAPEHESIV